MITRRTALFGTLIIASAGAMVDAPRAQSAKPKVFSSSSPKAAINGYDPVAYFTMSKPVAGDAQFSAQFEDATWYFSSAANKAMFVANPQKYAPQYGGYCAYAVSTGYTASTVPEAWSIVGGKLYLNYSLGVRQRWKSDTAGYISKANKNWPGVLN